MNLLRPRSKRKELEQTIRDWIISGEIKAGSKLPSYEELDQTFNASRATVHHVLNELKRDGFIHSVERQGVFVSETPPHLNRFAILLQTHERSNLFWSKIVEQAMAMTHETNVEFVVFRGAGDMIEKEEWDELRGQLEKRLIGGLFLTFLPVATNLVQLINDFPHIPKVVLDKGIIYENCCQCRLNTEACTHESLAWLKEQGVKTVGLMTMEIQPQRDQALHALKQYGLQTRDEWVLAGPKRPISAIENTVKLLMSLPKEERPEALYITDDNILPYVLSGLIQKGVRVPDDIKLVCHCNFPDVTAPVVPVKRIGISTRELLEASVELIHQFYETGKCGVATISVVSDKDFPPEVEIGD